MNLIPIHMLLGLLVVLSLWIVGIGQAFSSAGSWPLALGALLLGLLVIGLMSSSRAAAVWAASTEGRSRLVKRTWH